MDIELFTRAILSLIFVVALIGIFAFVFQKLAIEKKLLKNAKGKKLKILEYQVVDSKRRLVLVGYNNKEILLLLSPNNEIIVSESEAKKTKKK